MTIMYSLEYIGIGAWNAFPDYRVLAPTINALKNRLKSRYLIVPAFIHLKLIPTFSASRVIAIRHRKAQHVHL